MTKTNTHNTLNDLIADLGKLRQQAKHFHHQETQVKRRIEAKEREIMDMLDDQNITESKGPAGKVTLTESVYPQVENWDEVYQFIEDNRYYHCLEKRFAVLAYREILGQGNTVPGVVPYTKRKITFRET